MDWFTKSKGLERLFVLGIVGSRAYGLETDESDFDIRGVAMPPFEARHDLWDADSAKRVTLKDCPSLLKIIDLPEEIDSQNEIWSVRRFFELASKGNPVAIELLWIDPSPIVEEHELWNKIRAERNLFLTHKTIEACLGHSNAHASVANEKADGKKAMHAVRLAQMAFELATTGEFILKRKDVDKFRLIKEAAEKFDPMPMRKARLDILSCMPESWCGKLPPEPNRAAINALYTSIVEDWDSFYEWPNPYKNPDGN